MALPPNATNEELEEELVFLEVLIASLDDGADDYAEKLATFQGQKEELERRLDGSTGGSRPQTSERQNHTEQISNMDGSYDENAWWNATLNGRPGSNGSQAENSLGRGGPVDFNLDFNFSNPYSYSTSNSNPYSTTNPNIGMENTNGRAGSNANRNPGVSNNFLNADGSNFFNQPYSTTNPNFGMENPYGRPSSNLMKRSLPQSMQADSLHPSKRPTPDPSNAATPTSSTDSFESFDRPITDLSERTIRRQLQAEAALKRQQEQQAADEEMARSLSQQNQPPLSYASSSRPNIQTTLNPNGSFQLPLQRQQPQPQMSQSYTTPQYPNLHATQAGPSIKQEPGHPKQQQLVQRSRAPEVIDLTNSDDEEVSEIGRNGFTPNKRGENNILSRPSNVAPPAPPPMRPQQQMPGSFPMPNGGASQSVYGNIGSTSIPRMNGNNTNRPNQPPYPWIPPQQTNPLMTGAMNAVAGIRNVANTFGNSIQELSNLVNGSSKARPWSFGDSDDNDEDDDIIFGGSRPVIRAPAPYAGYEDYAQYQNRYDAIANYDPLKTTEEINALLENIRPDEDMPQHLRVQTP